MSERSIRDTFAAALGDGRPASDLDGVVAEAFPDLSAFREEDDLIILAGETRRLLVRRTGPDRFRVVDTAAASGSTNLLDAGEGTERDLDGLVEEIATFAGL
jgi:hypothetical protein